MKILTLFPFFTLCPLLGVMGWDDILLMVAMNVAKAAATPGVDSKSPGQTPSAEQMDLTKLLAQSGQGQQGQELPKLQLQNRLPRPVQLPY